MRTSWLGYYSRFNGGLISQICYALLFWAFVSNLNKKHVTQVVYSFISSTIIVAIIAVLERFNVNITCGLMNLGWTESCWIQDVESRVFSTLGQPNWLAALLVILIPLTWFLSLKKLKDNKIISLISLAVSGLFFIALIFTKSRSGLLAFALSSIVFWGLLYWQYGKKYIKQGLLLLISFLVLYFISNSSFNINPQATSVNTGPALETGGTESGVIRKYVWLGAFEIFKNYPIFGTGPETFAYIFPRFKPVEHNLTSEWNFVYNKAHNEYLNYLANTGIFGFISYLTLILVSIFITFKKITGKDKQNNIFQIGILSGYISILITNFFGFSVVPISLLFFLLPAMSIAMDIENNQKVKPEKMNLSQIILMVVVTLLSLFLIQKIYLYWQADRHYNNTRNSIRLENLELAKNEIDKALKVSPNEPFYIIEQSLITKDIDQAAKALDLSPYNQSIRSVLVSNLSYKAVITRDYFLIAEEIIKTGLEISPKDPKLYYQLGILNLKNNKVDEGLSSFSKSIELKPNYKEARFAIGLTYIDIKNYEKAIENLEYILTNIDPNDQLIKKYLDEAKSGIK